MAIQTRMLRQRATYWAPVSGKDATDAFGKPLNRQPIQIKVRWEEVVTEVLDVQGRKVTSSATVYVDRDLVVGGVLCLGELKTMKVPNEPFKNPGAYEIKVFQKLPSLKNQANKVLRTCYL